MTTINVFTSEDCGQCDAVVERAETLASETDAEVAVYDVEEDRSRSLEHGVFSVPTTVVGDDADEATTIRGVPELDELRDAV